MTVSYTSVSGQTAPATTAKSTPLTSGEPLGKHTLVRDQIHPRYHLMVVLRV
ncbi:hypothetical protein PISMIDRAFT_688831, partial [Pisolithus microcarpus 441]